jgi:hypothetical protein
MTSKTQQVKKQVKAVPTPKIAPKQSTVVKKAVTQAPSKTVAKKKSVYKVFSSRQTAERFLPLARKATHRKCELAGPNSKGEYTIYRVYNR